MPFPDLVLKLSPTLWPATLRVHCTRLCLTPSNCGLKLSPTLWPATDAPSPRTGEHVTRLAAKKASRDERRANPGSCRAPELGSMRASNVVRRLSPTRLAQQEGLARLSPARLAQQEGLAR